METSDGIIPSNPATAHIPIEKGGIVFSRQGGKINIPLGGLGLGTIAQVRATKVGPLVTNKTANPLSPAPAPTPAFTPSSVKTAPSAPAPAPAYTPAPRTPPPPAPAQTPTYTTSPEPYSPPMEPTSASYYSSPEDSYASSSTSSDAGGGGGGGGRGRARQRPSTGIEEDVPEEAPRMSTGKKVAFVAGTVGGIAGIGYLVKWLRQGSRR